MKIIVDGMGGDKGYKEVVKGCVDATKELGINILIVGQEAKLVDELSKYEYPHDKIEVINAEEVISNDEEPALAIRRKKNSSVVVGLKALAEGIGDGFVSAGSTGALLA
ncbi:MAG: phosphate--acyl-ACP acyltransferase, partial [Tissierellales bacterium]